VPTSLGGAQAPVYNKGGSGDHLVIERNGQALIGITDKFNAINNNTQDEEVWVSVANTSWYNTDLYDYSGAHGVSTTRVFGDGRVLVKTAPVGHTIAGANGHGYSVWAPKPTGVTFATVNDMYNYLATYAPARATTTIHEWEMANDLGDSHVRSLQQGGALPTNSTAQRTAGRIYAAAGKTITYKVFPEVNGTSQNLALYNTSGTIVAQVTGSSSNTTPLTGTYTPAADGWLSIRVKNSNATTAGQKVWVNVTYTAPTTVNTRSGAGSLARPNQLVDAAERPLTNKVPLVYPNPTSGQLFLNTNGLPANEAVQVRLLTPTGGVALHLRTTAAYVSARVSETLKAMPNGVYTLQLQTATTQRQEKVVKVD
jgi:alpha-amylase